MTITMGWSYSTTARGALASKVVVGLEIRKKGSLLMDIPNDIRSMDDLIDCAMDRQKWQIEVGALRKQLNIECNP